MKKKRIAISRSDKLMILEESFKDGVSPNEVAKSYKIPTKTLHNWRSVYRRQQKLLESKSLKTGQLAKKSADFIEVKLDQAKAPSGTLLKQVSLDFTDYIVQITGKIDDKMIGEILKISGNR